MEGKLIMYCPTEGGEYKKYKGKDITIKDFLLNDYETVIFRKLNKTFKTYFSSPVFIINEIKMHILVFSDGTFIRLKRIEGKLIEKHEDKKYLERLIKILNIKPNVI